MNLLKKELNTAIKYEQQRLKKMVEKDHWRLHYHQMPPTGWLNDPNGVCHHNGTFHLYYQYSPNVPEGGLKYWGHKTSSDLVHFKEEEIALYPDKSFDLHGVYSGSAFIKDGKIHFYYTGNVKYDGEHDFINSGREQNTIHVTSHDGFNFDAREVIIGGDDYPEDYTKHVRDPKIIEKNNMYYMVLGSRTKQDHGQILVYKSSDLYDWEHQGELTDVFSEMGYMWECPDFFSSNDKDVLMLSPQGVESEGFKYNNVYQSGYFIGNTDWDNVKFTPSSSFIELDNGFDFYAPQTFEDESGRRIMWGWMGLPDIEPEYRNPTIERGWQHAMTMPRELKIVDEKLYQLPLEEYKVLRQDEKEMNLTISGHQEVKELNGEVYELQVDVDNSGDELSIHLRQDTTICFSKTSGVLTLSHGSSGYGRHERMIELDELKQVRVFSDMSSLEIFINGGEYVFSTRVYPEPGQDQISFSGKGCIHVSKWALASTNERVS